MASVFISLHSFSPAPLRPELKSCHEASDELNVQYLIVAI